MQKRNCITSLISGDIHYLLDFRGTTPENFLPGPRYSHFNFPLDTWWVELAYDQYLLKSKSWLTPLLLLVERYTETKYTILFLGCVVATKHIRSFLVSSLILDLMRPISSLT